MDPFDGPHSPTEWWNEADLPDMDSEAEHPSAFPINFASVPELAPTNSLDDFLPETDSPPVPSGKKKRHFRVNCKERTLRQKQFGAASAVLDMIEEVFPYPESPFSQPSEVDSVASTAKSFASSGSASWLFRSLQAQDECVQGIETCLNSSDLDACTAKEKRRILEELKQRLRSIEGGVDSLKASLKKIIKYRL